MARADVSWPRHLTIQSGGTGCPRKSSCCPRVTVGGVGPAEACWESWGLCRGEENAGWRPRGTTLGEPETDALGVVRPVPEMREAAEGVVRVW